MNLKYKIAEILNLFPQSCWCNLVLWAEGSKYSLKELFNQKCRLGSKNYPYAYCGKCENTGRYW